MLSEQAKFRKMLNSNEFVFAPVVFDPLSARIAEVLGFRALSLGGYAAGAHLCTTEPIITLTEMASLTKYIAAATSIPVIVDGGAGFGEPVHVVRTVREFEMAGAAGVHIEDQIYPKRMHYHRDYREHIISPEEMVDKISYAKKARVNSDFVIIARTDALRTHGLEEGIKRARIYAEAGADMIMVFPNNKEEARSLPKKIEAPLFYVNSPGNRVGRPLFSVKELKQMGYKMMSDSTSVILAMFESVKATLRHYLEYYTPRLKIAEAIRLRRELENDYLNLPSFYSIEEKTTEAQGKQRK